MVSLLIAIVSAGAGAEPPANPPPAPPTAVVETRDGDLPPEDEPKKPPEPDFTHTFRAGPTMFGAFGVGTNNGSNSILGCGQSLSTTSGEGLRVDYSMQRGHGHIRWHVITALEVTSAKCEDVGLSEPAVDVPYGYQTSFSGLDLGFFAGSGVRYDSNPVAAAAGVIELDGTVGASFTHVGLLGVHFAGGARFDKQWEILGSVECELGILLEGRMSLVIGHSF